MNNDPKKYVLSNWFRNTAQRIQFNPENPSFDRNMRWLGVRWAGRLRYLTGNRRNAIEERTILINSQIQNEERKRFTQFHEITHYLIEKDGDLISETSCMLTWGSG